jgi:hypothetical protein
MNDQKNTSKLITELVEDTTALSKVSAPPFFKDKVLNRLSTEQTEKEIQPWLYWLTPNWQWAALVLFLVLNTAVLYYYNNAQKEQQLATFASTYGLSSSEESSILN